MNAKDLANMDMEQLAQALLHFWRWWTAELTGMMPPAWRERFQRRSRITAEFRGDNIVYRNEETGQTLGVKPRGAVKFLMPAECVLVRQIELPLLPMSDIKRMVALDIDRLTPFQPDQVYFDADIVARDSENGRQQVTLGVLPRADADRILEEVGKHDLVPTMLGVKAHGFDFIAAMRDSQGSSISQRRALYWWAGAAAFFAINLFLLIWRDSSSLDQLRQTVEAQQAQVGVAMRTSERVNGEETQRRELMTAKRRNAPLPVLDAVTAAMPQDAWVRRFEWNGRSVHIIGARKTSNDILARLEASPVLRNARSLASDSHADTSGYLPFDISADRETGAQR